MAPAEGARRDEPDRDSIDEEMEEREGAIAQLFDARTFRENAELVVARLERHLADSSLRGLELTRPSDLLEAARDLMQARGDESPGSWKERLEAILDLYVDTGIQVHSPGFMGRQFSGVIPLAGVFDLASSIVNQPSSFYEAGQLPNVAERLMAEELSRLVGWNADESAMVTTSGGSLANLTALLAARNDKLPWSWSRGLAGGKPGRRPAIAVSEDVHYCVPRAAGILGVGDEQVVRLPIDRRRRIVADEVRPSLDRAAARGLDVFCLVASAGTTSFGAIDPLDELAAIAEERDLWFHVDGAHGASLLVSDELRHKLEGIERADSFAWDAHKLMFVPAMCSLLFYKDKEKAHGAFRQQASYVFEKEPDEYTAYDSAGKNFECTKRPLIMNLWVLWSLYGRQAFATKIEHLCELAERAHGALREAPDFEPLHRPEMNILCFRYLPANLPPSRFEEFQLAIRNRIRRGGRFFISKVDVDGVPALRVVFMNHLTRLSHFRMLLDEIRREGQALLRADQRDV